MYRLKSNPLYDNWFSLVLLLLVLLVFSGCATESHRLVASEKVASYGVAYNGPRTTMAVGNFQNRSSYLRGLFHLTLTG